MSRRQARDMAFKVLFQVDQVNADPAFAMSVLLEEKKMLPQDVSYAQDLINGVLNNQEQIDSVLHEHSRTWKIERMFSVDRVLLRLGIYEVMIEPGLPTTIAIDEAVELGKRYGEISTPGFVNAVLDQVKTTYEKIV